MNRPHYLSKYHFDWEMFDVILGGQSALDANTFLSPMNNKEEVYDFLEGYGFPQTDPVMRAELFGNFQEALQFIRRYFLKEGNADGLDLTIPTNLYSISEVSDLFLMAMGSDNQVGQEERIWASIILKVMHIILHVDKDLRQNYFTDIQRQVFDRFYRFIFRDEANGLFLGKRSEKDLAIPLMDFQTKSRKSRDSIIIKLLHKPESVAEEVFDRIGIRIVTSNKIDILRAIKFLQGHHIIMAHNLKPSRTRNFLFNMGQFKQSYTSVIRKCLKQDLPEEVFRENLESELNKNLPPAKKKNENVHSSPEYRAIQFTCRQLIKIDNPFFQEFNKVRSMAKEHRDDNEIAEKILSLDTSYLSRNIRFFYPFEVQIVDAENHEINTVGEASHNQYKKSQLKSAMLRMFRPLLERDQ